MKEGKNNNLKFSPYWIYGVVITILLVMSMFGGDSSWQSISKTNISDFERFLNDGDVEEIIVVNQKLAKVTLSSYGLEKSTHKKVKSKNILGQENTGGPHYEFEVGNLELFQRKLEEAEGNGIQFRYEFMTVENRWMDVILGFLPIIVIIITIVCVENEKVWTRKIHVQVEELEVLMKNCAIKRSRRRIKSIDQSRWLKRKRCWTYHYARPIY